jgi:hypothetical protein
LAELISRYPEPITIEISNVYSESEIKSLILKSSGDIPYDTTDQKPKQLKSSFAFDLRQFFSNTRKSNENSVEGIIIQTVLRHESGDSAIAAQIINDQPDDKSIIQANYKHALVPEFHQLEERGAVDFTIVKSGETQPSGIIKPGKFSNNIFQKLVLKPQEDQKAQLKIVQSDVKLTESNSIPIELSDQVLKSGTPARIEDIPIIANKSIIKESRPQKQIKNGDGLVRSTDWPVRISNSDLKGSFQIESEKLVAQNFESLNNAIVEAVDKNSTIVRLKLQPERLGGLNIKMQFLKESVVIRILADKKETAEVIKASIPELKAGLESQNIKIQEITATAGAHNLASNSHSSGQNFRDAESSANPRNYSGQVKDESNKQFHSPEKSETPTLLHKPRAKSSRWIDYEA